MDVGAAAVTRCIIRYQTCVTAIREFGITTTTVVPAKDDERHNCPHFGDNAFRRMVGGGGGVLKKASRAGKYAFLEKHIYNWTDWLPGRASQREFSSKG